MSSDFNAVVAMLLALFSFVCDATRLCFTVFSLLRPYYLPVLSVGTHVCVMDLKSREINNLLNQMSDWTRYGAYFLVDSFNGTSRCGGEVISISNFEILTPLSLFA